MLDKGSKEKLLTSYEPRTYLRRPRKKEDEQMSQTPLRRHGSLFRVDLSRVIKEKEHFVFSRFLNRFIR
ncbi:uncharacterized protein Eint_100575 [Encephalitozoon intestinalis ATCC 50506]|uniref:Uncharacterized protein n=1 Tax=Encephalitozoon intestinalis (strain ATCC 50506) TaxID=876142 RepID=W8P951_ENCIT|nr:uncharacterized protein Eint_100575 [Encephalitozoon intestinalis ATCC 50506]AHL30158.1 hypothetical protein Eint_100575 [Encephalitozoon intestinalis ATCC 50506]UTX46216.1 hypothetical protein GPK93_10g18140 [Encephalitozoon intestinalis]